MRQTDESSATAADVILPWMSSLGRFLRGA